MNILYSVCVCVCVYACVCVCMRSCYSVVSIIQSIRDGHWLMRVCVSVRQNDREYIYIYVYIFIYIYIHTQTHTHTFWWMYIIHYNSTQHLLIIYKITIISISKLRYCVHGFLLCLCVYVRAPMCVCVCVRVRVWRAGEYPVSLIQLCIT